MTDTTTRHDPSRPARTRAETKAEITDRTAKALIEVEVRRRQAKTEKLRQARLAREAGAAAPAKRQRAKTTEPATRRKPG